MKEIMSSKYVYDKCLNELRNTGNEENENFRINREDKVKKKIL